MKIRQGFVTNSSSSSYVIIYEVNIPNIEEFKKELKEDWGRKGLANFETYYQTGKELRDNCNHILNEDRIEDNKYYIYAEEWSGSEGPYDNTSLIVADMVPKEYKKKVISFGDY